MLISEIIKNESCSFCTRKCYDYLCCNKFRVFKSFPSEIYFDIAKDIRFVITQENNHYVLMSTSTSNLNIELIIQDQDFLSLYNNIKQNLIFT